MQNLVFTYVDMQVTTIQINIENIPSNLEGPLLSVPPPCPSPLAPDDCSVANCSVLPRKGRLARSQLGGQWTSPANKERRKGFLWRCV